VSVALSLV